jgi:hypothetical protein
VDGNGTTDVVYADDTSPLVTVWLKTPSFGFQAPTEFDAGVPARALAVGRYRAASVGLDVIVLPVDGGVPILLANEGDDRKATAGLRVARGGGRLCRHHG